jgi:nicotinate dehydrogenase subunit A
MANELTLSVNGAKHVVTAAPDTPLLFVLRNDLKLTGPRLGCGTAQCGACSVLPALFPLRKGAAACARQARDQTFISVMADNRMKVRG